MDAVRASIVVAVTGCEEWWFGGVKGNESVTQCDICDHVSGCKCAVAHPAD